MIMALRAPARRMATGIRQSLKIGLIPADGIGHEVIPVSSNCASIIDLHQFFNRQPEPPSKHWGLIFPSPYLLIFLLVLNTLQDMALRCLKIL
jgi:hypothetical protein